MSYDKVKKGEPGGGAGGDYYAEELVEKRRMHLFIASLFAVCLALANFSVCIWIRFDLDFWEWVTEIHWYTYWNAMYVVMIAMLCHAANAGLTAYAAYTDSRPLLLLSAIFRAIIWILTLAGAIVICLYGVEESKLLVNELDEVFMRLIYEWDDNERSSRVMTMIQEYVGCCGAKGNRDDYFNTRKVVPDSCRHPVTGNCFGWGCGQTLAYWLEPWTCVLAGISLGFCAILDPLLVYGTFSLRGLLATTSEY